MIWFERKAANSFNSFHWQTGGWHSGKTAWRSGKTGALEKLALWKNWRSGKTDWRSGKTAGALPKQLALWQTGKTD